MHMKMREESAHKLEILFHAIKLQHKESRPGGGVWNLCLAPEPNKSKIERVFQ
jgi:hypothetical protein